MQSLISKEASRQLELASEGQSPQLQSELRTRRILVIADWNGPKEALALAVESVTGDLAAGFRGQAAINAILAGYLRDALGMRSECNRSAMEALRLERSPWVLKHAAVLLARGGASGRANEILNELEAQNFPRFLSAAEHVRGEMALLKGDRGESIRRFARSVSLLPQPWACEGLVRAGARVEADSKAAYRRFALRLRYPEPPGLVHMFANSKTRPKEI